MAPTYAGLSGKRLSIAITTMSTLGFLLFGYDQGLMSGIISDVNFQNVFHALRNNNTMQALVTSVYELGCFAGAGFSLVYGDTLGRRLIIIIGASIMIIGVIIQVTSFPNHIPLLQFFIGRVVTGIGNGMNTSTIPTYQAECSHTKNRGLLICIEGGIIAIGTMIAYWIDFGCHFGPPDLVWRFPIAFQIVFGIMIIVGMLRLPDSPRYLITRGKIEEGEYVLAALLGKEVNDHETIIQKQLVLDSIRASGAGKDVKYRDLLTGGPSQHFRRMCIGASSQIIQQLGGCNAVIYYLPVLLEDSLGESQDKALLIGGINMICYAVFATFSWFFIERIGRRKLFLGGIMGQCVSMIITFACLIPKKQNVYDGAVFGLFLYMCFFGATILPLPWLYPAEISPIKTRAKANAVSTCSNWIFNFAVVMITPVMVAHIGWGTYCFFAAMNLIFIPFMWIFYPETAGRSLEEIDLIFAKGYIENMSYVKASHVMPKLSDDEVDAQAAEYGLNRTSDDEEEASQEQDEKNAEKRQSVTQQETVTQENK